MHTAMLFVLRAVGVSAETITLNYPNVDSFHSEGVYNLEGLTTWNVQPTSPTINRLLLRPDLPARLIYRPLPHPRIPNIL
jgi:hypothetical protein